MTSDPKVLFQGTLVFAAPHMDDEVLACGGTMAQIPDKSSVHVIFATDGSKSPTPPFPWMGDSSADLPEIRSAEARAALDVLDIPEQNIHFLGYPDSALKQYIPELGRSLTEWLERLKPAHLFLPFRFDRHPDHLALYKAGLTALASLELPPRVVEYFVYYRWRLVPGGDIRAFLREDQKVQVSIQHHSASKLSALKCYISQTTLFFEWQDRPILPRARLQEVSRTPEIFLLRDPAVSGSAVFSRLRYWIPLVHYIEPYLKKSKDFVKHLIGGKSRV